MGQLFLNWNRIKSELRSSAASVAKVKSLPSLDADDLASIAEIQGFTTDAAAAAKTIEPIILPGTAVAIPSPAPSVPAAHVANPALATTPNE